MRIALVLSGLAAAAGLAPQVAHAKPADPGEAAEQSSSTGALFDPLHLADSEFDLLPIALPGCGPDRLAPGRILIVGDSLIEGGIGPRLEKLLAPYEDVEVKRWGRRSTGLARPDFFDWPEKLEELKAEFEPDLIIGYWGGNDCQGPRTEKGKLIASWRTDAWEAAYGAKVTEMVELMREGGCEAVVIGMPNMSRAGFDKRIARLNGVLEQYTIEAGGVFIPTWDLTSDESGKVLRRVEFEGRNWGIRGEDGVHFTTHGSKYMASSLHDRLLELYSFSLQEEPESAPESD